MKWKFNIVKTITTPIEIDAESFSDALDKLKKLNTNEINADHGKVSYIIDAKPSGHLIKWAD